MDDPKPKYVPLIPFAEAQTDPPAPPHAAKVPAETRSPEEEDAERIVKTSKYKT